MKHISTRALLLLLALLVCTQLCAVTVSAAPTAGIDGTVDTYLWERVDSQSDLPETKNCPVLLLYEWNGEQYMVDAHSVYETEWDNSGDAHWNYQFTPVELPDGVRYGEKTFRTLKNVGHMLFSYADRKDSNNGNAKIYTFRSESEESKYSIAWQDEYCYSTSEDIEYKYISVLTPGTISDVKLESGNVGMFANISWRSDCLVRIDGSSGKVYSVRSSSWDMGHFVMYVGHKEILSSIRNDYTIGSGSVANYNGYIYIEPGVTVTVEAGGVMSISGIIYNNGAIKSTGGDIVVQKGATIEQFCLDDAGGGTIECNSGDLIILSGGLVATGKSDSKALGYGDSGFVLSNGGTCTNFGTLVIGSSAYLISGAAIDNRTSGTVLVGYKAKAAESGNLNTLTTAAQKKTDTYKTTAYTGSGGTYSASLLYGGNDAILKNDGAIYLSAWARRMTGAAGIVGQGSGKIHVGSWAKVYAERYSWSAPQAWQAMFTE